MQASHFFPVDALNWISKGALSMLDYRLQNRTHTGIFSTTDFRSEIFNLWDLSLPQGSMRYAVSSFEKYIQYYNFLFQIWEETITLTALLLCMLFCGIE